MKLGDRQQTVWLAPAKKRSALRGGACALLFIVLFIFAMNIYHRESFSVSADLANYLTAASNIASGKGFVDFYGRTDYTRSGFKLLLAAVILLWGHSLNAVAQFIQIVSAFLVVLIFALGLRLYNWRVGLAASLLFLLSPQLIYWTPRHLDPFWPAFLLGSLLVFLTRRKGSEVWPGVIAGLMAASAVLIKETALLFLPLPLLLYVWSSGQANRQRVIAFYIASILPPALWLASTRWLLPYGTMFTSQYAWQYEHLVGGSATGHLLSTAVNLVKDSVEGFWDYFGRTGGAHEGLMAQLPFAGVLYAALGVTALQATRGKVSDRILLLLFVLFLPFYIVIGFFNLRLPQNLLGIAVLDLCLASVLCQWIDTLLRFLAGKVVNLSFESAAKSLDSSPPARTDPSAESERRGRHSIYPKWRLLFALRYGFYVTMLVLLIASNVLWDFKGIGLIAAQKKPPVEKLSIYQRCKVVETWLNSQFDRGDVFLHGNPEAIVFPGEKLARYFEGRVRPNESVLVGDEYTGYAVHWFSNGSMNVVMMPFWFVSDRLRWPRFPPAPVRRLNIVSVNALWPKRKANNLFILLGENQFQQLIMERRVKYIAVPPSESYLLPWLREYPGLQELLGHAIGYYTLFKVKKGFADARPPAMPVIITGNAQKFLQWLHREDRERFLRYAQVMLKQMLGFDDEAVDRLVHREKSKYYALSK